MAISVVQAVAKTSTTAGGASFTLSGLTTTAGNLFVVAVACQAATTVTSVTDSASNSWSLALSETTNVPTYIYTTTASLPSAITSVTTHQGGNQNFITFEFYEISGANNTTPVDVSSTGTAASGTAADSGTTATPAGAADLAIGIVGWTNFFSASQDTSPSFTSGAGTNHFNNSTDGSVDMKISTSTLILSGATAQKFSTTLPASSGWGALVALISPKIVLAPAPKVIGQALNRAASF